jgi:hypothetical protein
MGLSSASHCFLRSISGGEEVSEFLLPVLRHLSEDDRVLTNRRHDRNLSDKQISYLSSLQSYFYGYNDIEFQDLQFTELIGRRPLVRV